MRTFLKSLLIVSTLEVAIVVHWFRSFESRCFRLRLLPRFKVWFPRLGAALYELLVDGLVGVCI
jgi:hypothetical protein